MKKVALGFTVQQSAESFRRMSLAAKGASRRITRHIAALSHLSRRAVQLGKTATTAGMVLYHPAELSSTDQGFQRCRSVRHNGKTFRLWSC